MNKIMSAVLIVGFLGTSAMAGDISNCGGQYLVEVTAENYSRVHTMLTQALNQHMIAVHSYNPNVGPYSMYGLSADPTYPNSEAATLKLMQTIQKLPGSIVECDQTFTQN
jgi:hypothetical protein